MLGQILFWAVAGLGLLTAWFTLMGARVEVRDNQDKFIEDLQQQGRWMRWAAMSGLATAVAAVVKDAIG